MGRTTPAAFRPANIWQQMSRWHRLSSDINNHLQEFGNRLWRKCIQQFAWFVTFSRPSRSTRLFLARSLPLSLFLLRRLLHVLLPQPQHAICKTDNRSLVWHSLTLHSSGPRSESCGTPVVTMHSLGLRGNFQPNSLNIRELFRLTLL